MIVVMQAKATAKQIGEVIRKIEELGFKPHLSKGEEKTIIGVVGNERKIEPTVFTVLSGVEAVIPILKPYKLASREFKSEDTLVSVNGIKIGAAEIIVMAGPCAVESKEQVLKAAQAVKKSGAKILRGGAFKPRTSPYSFQGLGQKGLEILKAAKEKTGLSIVTEVLEPADVNLVSQYADILQIGARNMQNFALLEEVGKINKPVLLKRGMMSTVEELLLSAEYVLSNGNYNVILCERGIRTFEKYTRNTLDISAVALIKRLSHLPVIVDPSHATGDRNLIKPMSKAAIAGGADGLLIEVHPCPEEALCDGYQSLNPEGFEDLMQEVRKIALAVGRKM
ncbi:MAG: 3-deoxy-7-phosphoheptulonate synthase [candidate division Zixibacteria bacterium RBG_16_48_11]|nr:MAG: 3-deoxy-7-phosphoheptulonate synthase [candidate division Zixibacteria bacterium RBG_16_48_11]